MPTARTMSAAAASFHGKRGICSGMERSTNGNVRSGGSAWTRAGVKPGGGSVRTRTATGGVLTTPIAGGDGGCAADVTGIGAIAAGGAIGIGASGGAATGGGVNVGGAGTGAAMEAAAAGAGLNTGASGCGIAAGLGSTGVGANATADVNVAGAVGGVTGSSGVTDGAGAVIVGPGVTC